MLLQQARDVCTGPECDHRHGEVTQFVKVFRDYPLDELRRYIDWQPFFNAWEMRGRFPDILTNPDTGEAAQRLYEDAQAMLGQLVEERWLRASGVFGLFPANRVEGEDIEVYADETRQAVRATLHQLRQQAPGRDGSPRKSLADFVAAKETGLRDYIGAFAVTAGLGVGDRIAEFKKANDDYSAIMLEALADRLAEAFAERLHERVRKEYWAYAPDEALGQDGLLAERYTGIRPAPGYPACPEHTEKRTIWQLLDVEAATGIELTESMAMWPGASVSGLYFSHPQARYFVLGRIGRDQVEDYARRKGWSLAEAEGWLSPNLGYRTEDE
jgi:5-methyltetrahydrofolate--homocysteine methyltransferase